MKLPGFLAPLRSAGASPSPVASATPNPGRELALVGAAKRKAEAKAKFRAFHRQMRADLDLPPAPEFDDR
jgi:hypothetical protein